MNFKWTPKKGLAAAIMLATLGVAATGYDRLKNNVKLGDGVAGTKKLEFDIGNGSTNPAIRSSSGQLQFSNDGTNFVAIGGGSTGELNFIAAPDAESGLGVWTTYQDAAASTPVNGTGGSPSVTFALNSTTPIRGNADFKFSKGATNRQGDGFSYDFTIKSVDKSKKHKIQFSYNTSAANYVAGDVVMYVYDVTNSTLITPSTTAVPSGTGVYQITWDATTSLSYRLIGHVATTNATAYDLYFDDFVVGPGQVVQGAAVGTTSYTLTPGTGFGTTTNNHWYTTRVGSRLRVMGSFQTGTTNTTTAYFSMPTGLTVNSARYDTDIESLLGTYTVFTTVSTETYYAPSQTTAEYGVVFWGRASVDTSRVYLTNQRSSARFSSGLQTSDLFGSNKNVTFEFEIEVAEWANSTVNLGPAPDVEYASNSGTADANDTSSFVYGPAGALGPLNTTLTTDRYRRVRFQYPIQATDAIRVQVDLDGTGGWIDAGVGGFNSSGTQLDGYRITANTGIGGVKTVSGSTTDLDINFGRYRYESNNWSFGANARWRVAKAKSNAATGFGLASITTSGLSRLPYGSVFADTHASSGTGGSGVSYGSTNTFVPILANATTVGTSITRASSASAGDSYTINEAGIYTACFSMGSTADSYMGITVNGDGTTQVYNQSTVAKMPVVTVLATGTRPNQACATLPLVAGDVLRPQVGTTLLSGGNPSMMRFQVVQVARQ